MEKEIKISFKEHNKEVLICVSDNGHGVDDKYLEKIFEALYTSDKGRKVAGLGSRWLRWWGKLNSNNKLF